MAFFPLSITIVNNFGCAAIETLYVSTNLWRVYVLYLEQSMREQAGLLVEQARVVQILELAWLLVRLADWRAECSTGSSASSDSVGTFSDTGIPERNQKQNDAMKIRFPAWNVSANVGVMWNVGARDRNRHVGLKSEVLFSIQSNQNLLNFDVHCRNCTLVRKRVHLDTLGEKNLTALKRQTQD